MLYADILDIELMLVLAVEMNEVGSLSAFLVMILYLWKLFQFLLLMCNYGLAASVGIVITSAEEEAISSD